MLKKKNIEKNTLWNYANMAKGFINYINQRETSIAGPEEKMTLGIKYS